MTILCMLLQEVERIHNHLSIILNRWKRGYQTKKIN